MGVKPGEEVVFLPTHTSSTACVGKVFTVEMHHKRHDQGCPGDNIGMNVKGLDKQNMPRTGDVMVYKKDSSLGACASFAAQIQVLDIPGVIKIAWKVGKETGGKKMEDPHSLKTNEMSECHFEPQQPLVVDTFKNCEGLSRIAFLDGN